MPIPAHLVPALQDLVRELVRGNFDGLERDGRAGRLTAAELRAAVRGYGRTLVDPPTEAFGAAAHPVRGAPGRWAIELDLWTVEEGRSDLTLTVAAQELPDRVRTEVDDLHVL
jgi:hypothetical protein